MWDLWPELHLGGPSGRVRCWELTRTRNSDARACVRLQLRQNEGVQPRASDVGSAELGLVTREPRPLMWDGSHAVHLTRATHGVPVPVPVPTPYVLHLRLSNPKVPASM